MEQYRVINDQPIAENLFFWKYSDYERPLAERWTRQTPAKRTCKSKSPKKQKEKALKTEERIAQQELDNCTFKPKLISNNTRYWNQNELQFHQRAQIWNEQKQTRLMQNKLFNMENSLKECTFQPRISEYNRMLHLTPKRKVSDQQSVSPAPNEMRSNKVKYKYCDALTYLHKELHNS